MRLSKTTLAISALAVLATVAYGYLCYQAGCAGDTKGGSLGNIQEALQLEGLSIAPLFLALASLSALPIATLHGSLAKRSIASAVIFVISLAGLILLGIQAEIVGVQQCFSN